MPIFSKKPKIINICVSTLESELDFAVRSSTTGKSLLDCIARTIGLREVWYFGLLYQANDGEKTWLNLDKKVSSINALKCSKIVLEFRVKFFPEDSSKELIQEITQRLFFLQVKESILKDKLPCLPETAVLLASYACQAKYGDYDEARFIKHPITIDRLLSPNTLVNHDLRSEDWIRMVIRWYEEHQGMYPQTAMLHYLEIAEGLETYGVEFFDICNLRGTGLLLGIDAMGLAIYKPPDKITPKVGFSWSEIRKIAFNDHKFTIKPIDKKSADLVFLTKSLKMNKKILALCIGNNELYVRRRQPLPIEIQQMRSQAQEENAFRELERERLSKEKTARLEAERRVRELEARLKETESRLQVTSSIFSSQSFSNKQSASSHTSTELEVPVIGRMNSVSVEVAAPTTVLDDLFSRSNVTSRKYSLPSLTTGISTASPTATLANPNSSLNHWHECCQPRQSFPPPSTEADPAKLSPTTERRLPRQRLETIDPEEALRLLESTWTKADPDADDEPRIPSPLIREVEFPPAVVENLRSEELRQSAISRNPKLQAKLRDLHLELRAKERRQESLESQEKQQVEKTNNYTVEDDAKVEEEGEEEEANKFDTIRKIRRGNTKRRVDVFEAL